MGPRQTRWTFSARRPDRVQARWQFGRRVPTIEDLEAQSRAFPMEYSTALPTIRKRGSRAPNNPSSFLAQVEGWHQRRRVGDSSTSRPLAQGPSTKGVSCLLGLLIWNACNSTSIKLWDLCPAYPSTALQVLWGAALLRQPRCRRSPPLVVGFIITIHAADSASWGAEKRLSEVWQQPLVAQFRRLYPCADPSEPTPTNPNPPPPRLHSLRISYLKAVALASHWLASLHR